MQQYHFKGKGFSGRAVRIEELDLNQCSSNLLAAAKIVGPDATGLELKKVEWRTAIKQMIVEISDPCEDPLDASVKWKKVKPVDLDDLSIYFKPKDMTALENIYRQYHELGESELEAITGKAIPVSSEG